MSHADHPLVHLRAHGVSLVIEVASADAPSIVHWGASLGDAPLDSLRAVSTPAVPDSTPAASGRPGLLPAEVNGFLGRPALSGSRRGTAWSPDLRLVEHRIDGDALTLRTTDPLIAVTVDTRIELREGGVLALSHRVTNDGAEDYTLEELALSLPVPERAGEVLDFGGRWSLERQPQRRLLETGTWLRELRHGRTGFDAPLVLATGTPGFRNRSGDVWGVHFGWSGNARIWSERTPEGYRSLGAAELFPPGGLVLASGASYTTPVLYAASSEGGLDGISSRFHRYVRSRSSHPASPRPVTFNSWEAVYFNHGDETVGRLVDAAAAVGVERFVLDDGWFLGRRNDRTSLGDWVVDRAVWPSGLGPIIDRVRAHGMQFGLWIEPEMVSPDSELFRAHPDWALVVPGRAEPVLWRNQLVLDVANPEVFDYLFAHLDALLTELDIAYLKWDHNRDLVDAGRTDGRQGVHETTLAVYRLLDALRERHPAVEIESCSSGGGRVDLGILERTDRVWGSDTNDALDRYAIQRWTAMLLPPELVGSHVGPPTAHITGRSQPLAFRAAVATFGSFGIEWDFTTASAAELEGLGDAVAFAKRVRDLVHTGELVHADLSDPSAGLDGVVAADGSEALFRAAQLATAPLAATPPVVLPGLIDEAVYEIVGIAPADPRAFATHEKPEWWGKDGVRATGRQLRLAGLALPALRPQQALFVQLTRVDTGGEASA